MGALGWDCATSGYPTDSCGPDLPAEAVTLAVVHSAETQELEQSAEGVAAYFQTIAGSTHVTTDVDSIAASVPPGVCCWGTGEGGVNRFSVQAEQAGVASQDRSQWLDAYSRATITNTAAWGQNAIALFPRIRPVFLVAEQLLAGERYGFTSHGEVHAAWPQGDGRTDPGPAYPWDVFLAMLTHTPTEDDLSALFATLAEIEERNMAKARLVRASDGADPTTWLVGTTTKTALEVKHPGHDPIAEVKYLDLVLANPKPTGPYAIPQDANGVEMWKQATLDQFTTV